MTVWIIEYGVYHEGSCIAAVMAEKPTDEEIKHHEAIHGVYAALTNDCPFPDVDVVVSSLVRMPVVRANKHLTTARDVCYTGK